MLAYIGKTSLLLKLETLFGFCVQKEAFTNILSEDLWLVTNSGETAHT